MEATIQLVSIPRSTFPDQPGSAAQDGYMKEARIVEEDSIEAKMNEIPSQIKIADTDHKCKKKMMGGGPLVEGSAAGYHFLFSSTDDNTYSCNSSLNAVPEDKNDDIGRAVLVCIQCGYKTENSASLVRHTNRVHKKQYGCDQCSFKTGRRELLNAHIYSTHNGWNDLRCRSCDFVATQKIELHKHILISHEKVKTYPCGMCSYMAVRKNHLERHILSVHEISKQFQCSLCPYKSPRKDKLDRHVSSVHEKLKPFACQFCSYRASRKTNLNKHILNFHVELSCTL